MAEQKKIKLKIEDVIPQYLDSDMRRAALDFAAWLRLNKLTPGQYGINRWKASNKGTGICFIVLGSNVWKKHDSWVIRLDFYHIKEYEASIINEGLQEFVWANIHHCWNCAGCAPGVDMTIMGKEFKGICYNSDKVIVYICDPGEAEFNVIKRLLEFEKKARAGN